jgi:predicted DNA-binding protein
VPSQIGRVIPSYTSSMKTAISVPDETYDRADRVAKAHGMNRSQFYSRAADRYADELESADLTAAIDAVVDVANADESTQFAVAAGRRALEGADEEW